MLYGGVVYVVALPYRAQLGEWMVWFLALCVVHDGEFMLVSLVCLASACAGLD